MSKIPVVTFAFVLFVSTILAENSAVLSNGFGSYLFSSSKATWKYAKLGCAAIGAHLAVMETTGELEGLKVFLEENLDPMKVYNLWIGGKRASNDTFVWDGTNEAIVSNWWPGLDATYGSDEEKDCLQIKNKPRHGYYAANHHGTWLAGKCSWELTYVCEM